MQKWARPMLKVIARNSSCEEEIPKPHFKDPPPPIEWHVTHDKSKFSMMSLHPVEIARQITIKEFDLFRQVTFYIYFSKLYTHSKGENYNNSVKPGKNSLPSFFVLKV